MAMSEQEFRDTVVASLGAVNAQLAEIHKLLEQHLEPPSSKPPSSKGKGRVKKVTP